VLSTWDQDRHPDHAACARAARRFAADRTDCTVAEYPIWAWHWADPAADELPATSMRKIPVSPVAADRRWDALRRYRSQVLPLSDRPGDEAVVGPHVTAHFDRPFDVLVEPRGCASRREYFEALYADSEDPWGSGSRWYERRKRALLLSSLPRPRFAAAFEPGCGPGHLTVDLARRCDTVLAVDAVPAAVALARSATATLPGVSVRQQDIGRHWPDGTFDLVVLSEIAYYFRDLERLTHRLVTHLRRDAVVVLCHWRHPAVEHVHSAQTVHDVIRQRSGLHLVAGHREQDFLLDVLAVDGTSVARADGILD
jgi:SAM-dependent methyltransferase